MGRYSQPLLLLFHVKIENKMKAKIIHRVDDTITAYLGDEKVKICYITGSLSGKGDVKIHFQTETERLKKFIAYCENEFKTKFEIVTETKYHLKWTGGNEWDIYAASDEDAIRIGNSYLNTESGSVTQGERFVGNILSKPPTEWYIARKTWKCRDRTNPRYVHTISSN